MAFWSKWFSASPTVDAGAARTEEYKGFTIEARPYKDGGQFQLAGTIRKDGKTHSFIRADKFTSKDDCVDIAMSKGRLIVDQMGEKMFQ